MMLAKCDGRRDLLPIGGVSHVSMIGMEKRTERLLTNKDCQRVG